MNLDVIFPMLDWNNTVEIQQKGIEIANDIKDISSFILPITNKYNKNIWDNCAKIVASRTDEYLVPYLPKIFEWLQDLNWPGAFIIVERLKIFNSRLIAKPYNKAVIEAMRMDDDNQWLDNLSFLIEKEDLAKLLDSNTQMILNDRFYHGFWSGIS